MGNKASTGTKNDVKKDDKKDDKKDVKKDVKKDDKKDGKKDDNAVTEADIFDHTKNPILNAMLTGNIYMGLPTSSTNNDPNHDPADGFDPLRPMEPWKQYVKDGKPDALAVFGYIREYCTECNQTYPSGYDSICMIISMFYIITQQWNVDDKDDDIILSNNNLTISYKGYDVQAQNHLIRAIKGYSAGIRSYEIKVDIQANNSRFITGNNYFGFATINCNRIAKNGSGDKTNGFWGFRSGDPGTNICCGDAEGKVIENRIADLKDTIIKFTLDFKKKTISAYVDNELSAIITSFENNGEKLYPALFVGCYHSISYTAKFDV